MEYDELARMAFGFVLEDETWPAFLEWCQQNHISEESRLWLKSKPDINRMRRMWVENSPDVAVRVWAGIDQIEQIWDKGAHGHSRETCNCTCPAAMGPICNGECH